MRSEFFDGSCGMVFIFDVVSVVGIDVRVDYKYLMFGIIFFLDLLLGVGELGFMGG